MPKKDIKSATESGLLNGVLTVQDQQSRYHAEATEHSIGKEIVVKTLSIAIGQKEILKDAELQLQPGRHYVLAGRNGIGKSTLLSAIATDQIPSIPRNIRTLLLGQTQTMFEDNLRALKLEEQTVLQCVVRSDKQRERLLHESRTLAAALENSINPFSVVKAYRQISHERLERRLDEANSIAIRRSGARGKKAREVLVELEREMELSLARLNEKPESIDAAHVALETQSAGEMLAELETSLDLMDASTAETKARSVLSGLGFSQQSIESPVSHLSGGWRTRCELACALCQSCDLLLLDEPTNFLDLPSIMWLERYITEQIEDATVVVVTHDRAFADAVADELLVLRHLRLERHRGNLSNYELEKIKTIKWMSKMSESQEKQKKHMEKTIENSVKAAKRTGDDKKLKVAASRKKKIDDRMGLQVSAKGGRFKLNRDLVGYYTNKRDAIDIPEFDPPVHLGFPTSPADLRFPGALLSMEKINFAYTVRKVKKPILQDIDLTIHLGERVGIAGLNGAGKSTLVGIAMGTLTPSSGTVTRHTRARFGLFSQRVVEELNVTTSGRPELTALAHLMEHAGSGLEEKEARGLLGSLGLQGKTVSEIPLQMLSGGQKVRLALAKLLWQPPHLLILDEVTTHLDAETIEGLVVALAQFEGALLVVTHDRFFMRCAVEGQSPRDIARSLRNHDDTNSDDDESSGDEDENGRAPGRVYRLTKGKLSKLDQGMEQYEKLAAKASSKLGKA